MNTMRNDGYDIARDVNKSIANKDQELYDTISKYGYNQDFATFRRRVATEAGYRKRVYDSVAKAGFNVGFGFDEWDNEHVLDRDFTLNRVKQAEKPIKDWVDDPVQGSSVGQVGQVGQVGRGEEYKTADKAVLDLLKPNSDVVRINNQLKKLDTYERSVLDSDEYKKWRKSYDTNPFTSPSLYGLRIPREDRKDSEREFPKLASIRRQRQELEKQLQTIKSAEGKDDAWYKKLGRGAWNAATTVGTWDMGMGELEDIAGVKRILNKIKVGKPLEDYEIDELSTLAASTFVNSEYGKDISSWEKIGGGVVESVPFMLEMFVWGMMSGGAGTFGAMAAKGGSKQMSKMLMKKLGQEGYKKLIESTSGKILKGLGKGALRVGGDVLQGVAMANTTGSMRTAADAIDRNMGVAMPELDADGNIHYGGHEGGVGLGEAIFKAEAAQSIEYVSEMAGEYFEPLGKLMGKGFNKLPANRLTNSIRRGVRKASNSGAVRYARELGNAVHFNSPVGETAEEYVGGLMNALIVGDQTLDADPETGLFTREMFNQTVGVTGVTSLLFLGIGGVRYGGVRAKVHHQLKASDKAGKEVFGEEWDGIKKSIEGRSLEELNDYYNYVEANAESEEQSDVIQRYVRAYLADVGTQIGGALGIKEEVNEQLDGVRAEMQVRLSESDKNGERLFGEAWADVKADIEGRSLEELDDLYNHAERYTQVEGGADAIREYILAYKTAEANNVSAKREASVSEEEGASVSDKSDWSDKSDVVTTEASGVASGEEIGVPTTEVSGEAGGDDGGLDAIEAAGMDPAVVGEAAFNTEGYRAGVRSEVVEELGGEEAVHNGAVTTVGIKGLYGDFTLVGGDFKVTSNERGGLELEGDRDGVVYYRDSDGAVKPTLLGDIGDVKSSVDVETEVSARIEAAREAYRVANDIASEQSDAAQAVDVDLNGNAIDSEGRLVVDQINSIDDLTDDDFDNPSRSVELPRLPKEVDEAIGANGKPVVIKKNIFERNSARHNELSGEDSRRIISEALYNPDLYGQNQKVSRPNNWVLIHKDKTNESILLEVNRGKDNVEIVHWHYLDDRGIEKIKRQASREGGQILMLPSASGEVEEAGALSSRTASLSQGKGSENVGDTKSDPSREVIDRGDQITDPARVVGGRDYKGDEKSGGEQVNEGSIDNVGQGVTEDVPGEQAMLGALEELEERFGVQITVHRDASSIKERNVREAIEAGDTVKGWYNTRERSVHVYLPQAEGVGDITSTYLHEVVAHYGMRELLGEEKYNSFLETLWGKLDAEERSNAMKAANMEGMSADELSLADIQLACDEYVASIAERGDFDGKDRATWRKMVDAMLEILGEFLDSLNVSERDAVSIVEDLLSMSARNLERTSDKGKTRTNERVGTEVANDSRVKVREDGSKDYVGAGVEATIDDLFMETGHDTDVVDSAVQAGISEAEAKVKEAEADFEKRKKKVKGVQGVIALANERKATMSKLEGEVKFWQEVWDRLHPKEEDRGITEGANTEINLGEGNPIYDRWAAAKKVEGKEDYMILPNGERIEGRFVMVEADAMTPSHSSETMQPSEGFPMTSDGRSVNDNDYSDKRAIVTLMAQKYDKRALDHPVVVSDGFVISGNNRTMSGQMSARMGHDGEYLSYLRENASKWGFSPEAMDGFSHARVVFVPNERIEPTTKNMAKFNRTDVKQKSPSAKIKELVAIGDERLSRVVADATEGMERIGELYDGKHGEQVTKIFDYLVEHGFISQAELPQFFNRAEGYVEGSGKELLEGIALAPFVDGLRVSELFSSGMTSVRNKVIGVLPQLLQALEYQRKGKLLGVDFGFDIQQEMNRVARHLFQYQLNYDKDFKSVFVAQSPIFDDVMPEAISYASGSITLMLMDSSISEARESLNALNKAMARDVSFAERGGTDMFGEGSATAYGVFEDMERKYMERAGDDPKEQHERATIYNYIRRSDKLYRDAVERLGGNASNAAQSDGVANEGIRKDVQFRRAINEANSKQKQEGGTKVELDDDVLFRLTKRGKSSVDSWLKKREDLTNEEREAFMQYLEPMDNNLAMATGWWYAKGVIRVPEDQSKVDEAVEVARRAKVDPMRYGSPMEVLDTFKEYKIKGEAIDPESVPQLSNGRNVGDVSYGIRVYDVEDSKAGQQAMREIINTHWGEDANPWCLLQGDGNGNLSSDAWQYWNHYNGVSKRVAFKDGKLFAFCANDNNSDRWWDRQDDPHDGIPVDMKMPNDELGREATYDMNEDGTFDNPTNIHKGNKQNGVYEEWFDEKQLWRRINYKNGKRNGLREVWHFNGQLKVRENYKDGKLDGLQEEWYPDGELKSRDNYKNGELDGLCETWDINGKIRTRGNYKDGVFDGLYERWYPNGALRYRENYKNNTKAGVSEEWYENGVLKLRENFRDGFKSGLKEEWYENGQLRVRSNWKNNSLDGLYEEWDQSGNLTVRSIYKGYELVEDLTDDVRFRRNSEELEGIKRRAVAEGRFMKAPNGEATKLNEEQWLRVRSRAFKDWFGDWELPHQEVKVVEAAPHQFKNFNEAKSWAKENIARVYSDEDTGGKGEIRISRNAIDKYLSQSAIHNSSSEEVHLSVLKVLPDVIKSGIDAEQHFDYNKSGDGVRSPEFGINKGVIIHRVYSAVELSGELYRVKVTLKMYDDLNTPGKPHSYEAIKIELLKGTLVDTKSTNPSNSNSISATKLLKDVEKSYEKGKYLLDDYSKMVDENGEPMVFYHNTDADFTVFDSDKNGTHTDAGWLGDGFYFYGEPSEGDGYGKNKMATYLNIREPYYASSEENSRLAEADDRAESIAFREQLEEDGYDGVYYDGDLRKEAVVFNANQIKSATDNVGSFSSENDDIRFRRSIDRANSKQKQAGGVKVELDDDVLFRLTKRGKSSVDSWLKKREDLTNEEREAFMQYLEPMDNNLAMATGWWYAKGVIRVPEDQSKVDDAVEVAKRAKVDPLRYGSPMEVLDTFKEYKIKGEAIDPESVPQLSNGRNVGDVSYGIRVYDVEDSKAGQQAMREVINTHWGEDANPWCLLQGDGNGNLSSDAWQYWNHYNGVPKRVAFKDGKLLVFCANDYDSDRWWNRQDEPHDDISFDMKMPNDELGREATYEMSGDGILGNPTNIRRGNKQNGVYEEWNDDGQIIVRENYKNGKLEGVREEWYDDGQIMMRENCKNGVRDGLFEQWHYNGTLIARGNYKEGLRDGLYEKWSYDGNLIARGNYKDGRPHGLIEEWNDGVLMSSEEYKDDILDGISELYYSNGSLKSRQMYSDGARKGVYEEWYENGQPKIRKNYNNGVQDGLSESWYEHGQLEFRGSYTNGREDGVVEIWKPNGELYDRSLYKDGNIVEDLTDDVRFRRGRDIEAVNERFNEELGEQIAGKQKAGHVYQLGMPSDVLRSAGVPDLPIELAASRLKAKSEQANHPFDMVALKGLPIALSEPIAVFDYGDGKKSQNVIVDLESGGKNFLVGIFFNQAQRGVEVNDIRGLFPKDMEEWLNWATQGKMRYVDKERVLNLIGQRRINLAEVTYLDLELATKVVKDFENPKLEGSDVRFRRGRDIEAVNERFNKELGEQIADKQKAGHVYQLGMPSDVLRSAGVPDLPIELVAERLLDKSRQDNHPFELSEVTDLPKSVQDPLAVFRSATRVGSFVVLTELKHGDKSYVVAIEANKKVGRLQVNSIRSVHYRSSEMHIVNWINDGLAEYISPVFTSNWFNPMKKELTSKRQYNSADVRDKLLSATKVVKDFENPKFEGSDVRFRRVGDELKKREGEGLGEYAERMQRYHEANGRIGEASRVGEKPVYKGGSIGEYAREVTAYNDDPRVLLRGVGNVRIPEAPEVTSKMSIADVAKEMNDYHHRVREVNRQLEEDMRKCRSVSGRFKYNFVDRAAALETFNESMRASGIDVPPELDAYSDMMRSAGMSNIQLDKARFDVLNPLEKELSLHSEAINKSETFKGLRLEFRDKETGELLEGGDEAVSAFRIEGLYLQALDIIEAEELGLVGRGRSGFSDAVVLDGKSVTPEEFVKLYEGVVGFVPAERLQSRVKSCTDYILDICRAGGLIGEEAYREYRGGRMHYVPQRSWEKRGVSGLSVSDVLDRVASGSVFNPAVIEAKGRESLASNPLPFIANILQSSIFGMRANATKQKMLEWVERNYKELSDMGVVGLRRVYYVAKTDPVSGEVVRNNAGEVVYEMTTSAPSSEILEQDAATRKSIKEVKKEISDLKKELKSGKIEEEAYDEQIDELEGRLKELEDSIVVKFRGGDAPIEDVLTGGEKARTTVTVLRDGVEYQLQFNSRYGGDLVADVLNRNWATKAAGDSAIMRAMGKVTRKMSSLMTQYKPSFASANLIRDFGFASISNLADYGVRYQARFMKNMARVSGVVARYVATDEAKRTAIDGEDGVLSGYLREYFDLGSQTGWSYLPSVEELGKDMQRAVDPTTMQKVGDRVTWTSDKVKAGLSWLTEVSELTTRFAAYVTARETMNEDGQPRWSKEECAMMSKELTTNFDRRGAMSGVLGSMFGFFNASVQGTKAIARLANRNKGKVAGAVSLFTILGFIQALLQPDDDDDDATLLPFSEWDMMTNLCIGDYKIPLPHGFRGFWGFGTQLGLYVRGEKSLTDAVYNGLNFLADALLPEQVSNALEALCSYNEMTGELGPDAIKLTRLFPTATLPLIEVWTNRDFRGMPISRNPYSTRDEASDMAPDVAMSKGQTSEFMTAIARGLFELAGGDPDSGTRMKRDGSGMVPWWLDFNPSQMEHLWDGYTGVGRVVLDAMDFAVRLKDGEKTPISWRDTQFAKPFIKRNVKDFKRSEREMLEVRRQNGYLKELLRKAKDPQLMEEMQAPLGWGMGLEQAYDWAMDNGTYAQKVYLQKLMSDSVLKGYEDGNLSGDDALRIGKELSRNYRVKVMK